MGRVSKRVGQLSARMMRDSFDAAQTVTARMPALVTPAPSMSDLRERDRMVSEKVNAFAQGAVAASLAWGAFWMKASLGGVRTPDDFVAGMMDVADAATRPASRRVHANAKRLTGR